MSGTASEPRFDKIVQLAVRLFGTSMAAVALIDQDRQWLKAQAGFAITETPRAVSFCTHTIRSDDVLTVLDTRSDTRFAQNPLVTGPPFIRFYAGAPLVTSDGHRLGALCVADTAPRLHFSAHKRQILTDLAALVVEQMYLRRGELVRVAVTGFADATELALLSVDATGKIEFANQAATELFGYARHEMIGRSVDIIIPDRMQGAHRVGMARVLAGEPSKLTGKTIELSARKRDGSEFPIEMSLSVWHNERGVGMGAVIRDISERRERDGRLLRIANHDSLTGLSNRGRLEQLIAATFLAGDAAAVLLLDLDGFKDVNDSVGHAVGDSLLQAVSVRLPTVLPPRATLARFGGDEFAVLLSGVGDPLQAQACGTAILTALETPFELAGHRFQVGGSVGFAVGPAHGEDPEELIASADFALYRAKQAGGRTLRMFEPEMRHAAAARRATQDDLLRALQKKELVLHYQPQISLDDGRLIGVEALIRWQHPERGLLLPGAFLAAIETSSLALRVGAWVLDEACRQMAAWRAAGLSNIRVGINLFSGQFRSGSLGRQVLDAIDRHDIDPEMLELEVTETIVLQNDDHLLADIRGLWERGVRIAFDDFGTGYASLSTLKRFPVTTLKIDRSFVKDLLTDSSDAAITRAMITLGRELNLDTVAEGIETREQETALRALGCKIGQGYLYGKAMPAHLIAALVGDPTQVPTTTALAS
ncbi:EAL domain-containing protein [Hyphomicrobiales bacterium BP6-180914]|uniref:EAL domain-containing protein n=2 Tax=Lichenifustis flavocetrariae TaxID=2949735 RepID=A0AA41Z3V1_9HYPH|nr:EAL domain-containing protein [Lichenifustis flavocetrariae]MCW6509998.1 EAL domain-containing protein [Lichenifustis flavocetrariae]